jgi:hypothetical protein
MWAAMSSPLAKTHPGVVAAVAALQAHLAGEVPTPGMTVEETGSVTPTDRTSERVADSFTMLAWSAVGDAMEAELAGIVPASGRQVRYTVVVPKATSQELSTWRFFNHRRVASGWKLVAVSERYGVLQSKLAECVVSTLQLLGGQHRVEAVQKMREAKAEMDAHYEAQKNSDEMTRPWATTRRKRSDPKNQVVRMVCLHCGYVYGAPPVNCYHEAGHAFQQQAVDVQPVAEVEPEVVQQTPQPALPTGGAVSDFLSFLSKGKQ